MWRTLTSLFLLVAVVRGDDRLSETECLEAGFHPSTLLCSTCDQLPNYNLEQLLTDCKGCCIEDVVHVERYPLVILEICDCNIGRFPQVQAFVKSEMVNKWGSSLRVKQVRGVRPTLVLKDAYGQTRQTLNIEKWDTDTITEFLDSRIED